MPKLDGGVVIVLSFMAFFCAMHLIDAIRSALIARYNAMSNCNDCDDVEPGELIGKTTCPSCGKRLIIEYGDDDDEIVSSIDYGGNISDKKYASDAEDLNR